MSIPDYGSVVGQLKDAYPIEWWAAHTGGPDTEKFIRRLAWVLHQKDARFGLVGKRGNAGDISDDCVGFDGYSAVGDVDPTRGNAPVTVLDVIGGAGGSNPVPMWGPAGKSDNGKAAWVRPQPVGGQPTEPVDPQEPEEPQPVDLSGVVAALAALAHGQTALAQRLDAVPELLAAETAKVESVVKDVAARVDTIRIPSALEGRVLGQRFRLTPVYEEAAAARALETDRESNEEAVAAIVEALLKALLEALPGLLARRTR